MKNILRLIIVICSFGFAGCSSLHYEATTYGKINQKGEISDCGDFTFEAFESNLRVTPRRFGENSLVAYIDLGPGFPRDATFLIVKTDGFKSSDFPEEMHRMDPVHATIWKDAKLISGDFQRGDAFAGYMPQVGTTHGNTTNVERPEIRFVGRVEQVGASQYLFMHLDGSFFKPSRDEAIPMMLRRLTEFRSAIRLKAENQ